MPNNTIRTSFLPDTFLPSEENSPSLGFPLPEESAIENAIEKAKEKPLEQSHTQDKAILVHLYLNQHKDIENLVECQTLAESAGVEVLATLTTSRTSPHITYFVGKGKAEEIKQAVENLGATVVLVNHELSQTKVPMMMWFSKKWVKNEPFDTACLRKNAATKAYSHDNVFHSVLSMTDMNLKLDTYKEELDILASCRR